MAQSEQYQNRQEFDMTAPEEELQCVDPRCRRIFAHKAHTRTNTPAVTRSKA